MISKKRLSILAASSMAVAVLFTGCQGQDDTGSEEVETQQEEGVVENQEEMEEVEEVVNLSDWDGSWNNMVAYLDEEELQKGFEELAEREDMTVDEVKQDYIEDRKIDFDGLIINGDKITLLDAFEDEDGEVIEEIEFEFVEKKTFKEGNFETEWFAFKSDHSGQYKNLLLMPVHGEEALTHFHLRYGEDVDEILVMEDWYPTLVKPSSTIEQLYEEITE